MSEEKKLIEIIEDSLFDSFDFILKDIGYKNTKVVFSNQNGLEPLNTYCIINILDRERQGRTSESTYLTEDSQMWRTEFFKLCLQISFLGKEADSISWDFDDSFPASRTFIETFQKRSLGYIRKSKLRRMPQPRESKWVDMWNVDIDFSFAIQSRQEMDWIEYITVNGEVYRVYRDSLENRVVNTGENRTTYREDIRQVYTN